MKSLNKRVNLTHFVRWTAARALCLKRNWHWTFVHYLKITHHPSPITHHPSAMSAIIGAVIGSLTSIFGFAINGWFNLRSKEKDAENSIRQKQLENGFNFQKTHIIEPVIQFLESDLKLISQIYDLGLNSQHNEELSQRSSTHISMLPMIEARVSALSNSEASGKFQQFSRKRTEVGTAILGDEKPNINEAYEKLKESIHLASEILISLQNAIKQR